MNCCFAKEGEPTCFTWIGQANTPRLKARYQFQLALVNSITFAILFFCFPALFFTVPALILAVQAVKRFDDGNEEGCNRFVLMSFILNIIGIVVGFLIIFVALVVLFF